MSEHFATAPAKLNLYLHVLATRADGYHEVETLVVFASLADRLDAAVANNLSLEVTGPFAADAGPDEENLVLRAARLLAEKTGTKKGAALALEKNIPAGAGFGGGSADAAAALKLLNDVWELKLPLPQLASLGTELGADVPMCLMGRPLIARGIGEKIEKLAAPLPQLSTVLVWPRRKLATAQVYALLGNETPPHSPSFKNASNVPALFAALASTRNQLQRPAIGLLPEVAEALLALEMAPSRGKFVRMSGSGSGCYALLADADDAATLAGTLRAQYPKWWIAVSAIIP